MVAQVPLGKWIRVTTTPDDNRFVFELTEFRMTLDYFDLSDKSALVTGASSGLGVHFAKVLARQGVKVFLAARRTDKLAREVDSIRAQGGAASAISLDVNNIASVDQAFATLAAECGSIDILINNAGVADDPRRFLETGEEDWHRVIETNLNGAWRVAKAAAAQMVAAAKAGAIINIGSVYGLRTGVRKVAYNVSKAGVVQLTKSMAMELCKHNIRVNALCPGWFLTEITDDYFQTESGKRYVLTIPMKRMGAADDLTVPLLLLASNKAGAYITGSTLTVDGGLIENPV